MPKHYPALKMKMGTWDYFVVRMRMADVASEIKFAYEVNDDKTLDAAIQREIKESRAKKQIVKYLQINDQRFFNSLVVAALDGSPRWFPVNIEDDPQFAMVAGEVADSFGVLLFSDTIKTYALDGQHRLYAIKQLIEGQAENPPPAGFSDETISVTFVIPPEDMSREEFLKSYRRLFSALNRHAKSTAMNTNIIMDEDDRFAILTRRLISELDFFQWDGSGIPKIDTDRSAESLTATSNAYATIVGLYKMNVNLLWSQEISSEYGNPLSGSGWKELIQISPEDDEVDRLYEGLEKIWDGLLLTLPDLQNEPVSMRKHGHEFGDGENDSLLFWPIGQTALLAPIARRLLNERNIDLPSSGSEVVEALKPLSLVPWDLKHDLWRDFLITQDPETQLWRMRDQDRNNCLKIGYTILLWITGCETLNSDSIDELCAKWSAHLVPMGDNEREAQTFDKLVELREEILSL
jgi:DNA sulfur modification protein DndB